MNYWTSLAKVKISVFVISCYALGVRSGEGLHQEDCTLTLPLQPKAQREKLGRFDFDSVSNSVGFN